jgi:hypothetical protein
VAGEGLRARRKLVTVSFCPPQIPHNLTWDRERTSARGSRLHVVLYLYFCILKIIDGMELEAIAVVPKNINDFWESTPCSLADIDQYFGGTYSS